jgi:hypothetical protein
LKKGVHKFERWNVCETPIIFKEARAKARGAKTLIAQAYSLTCPRARLHSN